MIARGLDRGLSIFNFNDCSWLTAEFLMVVVRQKRAEYSTAFLNAKQNLGWQEKWPRNTQKARKLRRELPLRRFRARCVSALEVVYFKL